jgi:hypothetical protein
LIPIVAASIGRVPIVRAERATETLEELRRTLVG